MDYISRSQLFRTQREWFEAAAKRKAIIQQLFEEHFRLLAVINYLNASFH